MNLAPLNKRCPIHNGMIIADVCIAERCEHRLLCMKCRQNHPSTHSKNLFPLVQIFHNDISKTIGAHTAQNKNIIKRINELFNDIEAQFNELLARTKQEFLDVINYGSDTELWERYRQ